MNKFAFFLLAFWTLFVVAMLYLYFFEPQIFHQMFQYKGAGGPFVNTPNTP